MLQIIQNFCSKLKRNANGQLNSLFCASGSANLNILPENWKQLLSFFFSLKILYFLLYFLKIYFFGLIIILVCIFQIKVLFVQKYKINMLSLWCPSVHLSSILKKTKTVISTKLWYVDRIGPRSNP